jgi:hypothetical protein
MKINSLFFFYLFLHMDLTDCFVNFLCLQICSSLIQNPSGCCKFSFNICSRCRNRENRSGRLSKKWKLIMMNFPELQRFFSLVVFIEFEHRYRSSSSPFLTPYSSSLLPELFSLSFVSSSRFSDSNRLKKLLSPFNFFVVGSDDFCCNCILISVSSHIRRTCRRIYL